MIQKPFEAITKEDIEGLISNQVREIRTIEYKADVPGSTDDDKREFLADVSSFANTSGGDLLFGIEAYDAVPKSIKGLKVIADKEILRLEWIIRNGLEPMIQGIKIKLIEGFSDGFIIIIRIPKSWNAPHMVKYKNLSRFFSRNSAGKYQLDVSELRSAFILSESLNENIRRFRDERIGKIITDETPVPLNNGIKITLHILPFISFSGNIELNVSTLSEYIGQLPPMGVMGWDDRFNLDGYGTHKYDGGTRKSISYCQIFRSGHIESVYSERIDQDDEFTILPGIAIEKNTSTGLNNYLKILRLLKIPYPMIVMVTISGARGTRLATTSYGPQYHGDEINYQDTLLLPDILLEEDTQINTPIDAAVKMRPVFDALWNAYGFPRSSSFNDKGEWQPR